MMYKSKRGHTFFVREVETPRGIRYELCYYQDEEIRIVPRWYTKQEMIAYMLTQGIQWPDGVVHYEGDAIPDEYTIPVAGEKQDASSEYFIS